MNLLWGVPGSVYCRNHVWLLYVYPAVADDLDGLQHSKFELAIVHHRDHEYYQ